MSLILASSSPIRRAMLVQAGVVVEVVPANIDETALKVRLSQAEETTLKLSEAKALMVSAQRPGDWIIGSDSIVTVAGRRFDKPVDRAQAADHLRHFSGQEMNLTSAVALARDGLVEWSFADRAVLKLRDLGDAFIDTYLDAEWPEISYCVGVFRIEGRGVQLFDSIDGDHFTVLGMPLIPLLGALRTRNLVPA